MCSCETLQEEYPNLKDVFEFLKKIYLDSDILPEPDENLYRWSGKQFGCTC